MKKFLFFLACLAIGSPAHAQADHRGEIVTDSATYRGIKASAPIPPEMHIKNEGGSDGAGLCVPSSIIINGRYQKVPGLAGGKDSALWRAAKAAPGGYHPSKLANLVERVMPGEKYASFVGTGSAADRELLEKLSRKGYPIGATMNTAYLYNYSPIHHMISLIHYRQNGWACVVDNNAPGKYSWMPAAEWNRRWPDQGTAWAWIWTRLPSRNASLLGGSTLILIAAAILIVVEVKSRETQETAS